VQEARMDDLRETITLETDNIRITDRRAFIGWRTYEIADIRSVSLDERNLSPASRKAVIVVSLLCLIIGILSCLAALSIRVIGIVEDLWGWPRINLHFLFATLGLLFIYLWSIGWEADKPTYVVQIETASGKTPILANKDKDHTQRVIHAINDAIARRGSDSRNGSYFAS
jgi:hypothetical protein